MTQVFGGFFCPVFRLGEERIAGDGHPICMHYHVDVVGAELANWPTV
jgi:hypothetical protein